jgi:hypothetical protein
MNRRTRAKRKAGLKRFMEAHPEFRERCRVTGAMSKDSWTPERKAAQAERARQRIIERGDLFWSAERRVAHAEAALLAYAKDPSIVLRISTTKRQQFTMKKAA